MVTTVDKYEFVKAFDDYNRSENFSREGREALYDYLEDLYDDIDEKEYELDVIALCVEFTEYKNLKELQDNYTDIKDMDDLNDHTTVIEIPGTDQFIIQDY